MTFTVRLDGETHAKVEKDGPMLVTREEDGLVMFVQPGGVLFADVYIHTVISLDFDECRGRA